MTSNLSFPVKHWIVDTTIYLEHTYIYSALHAHMLKVIQNLLITRLVGFALILRSNYIRARISYSEWPEMHQLTNPSSKAYPSISTARRTEAEPTRPRRPMHSLVP